MTYTACGPLLIFYKVATQALASPAWIALTSSDPILTAFKLSWELQTLSNREHEFKDFYMELSEQCKTFACDLLSQCRSTEEVRALLTPPPAPINRARAGYRGTQQGDKRRLY